MHRKNIILLVLIIAGLTFNSFSDNYAKLRNYLVDRHIAGYVNDRNVIDVMRQVPRHLFVPASQRSNAYQDRPLPIGYGQTISQPSLVAKMTELLNIDSNSTVLEIGTGSGYQAAILSRLVKKVFTVEIYEELAGRSESLFKRLGYNNIEVLHADGYFGWKDKAPFDAIIVTCAAEFVPPPLISQLKPGGIMCIPVGPPFRMQQLLLLTKADDGRVRTRVISYVSFVPLLRSRSGN